MRSATPHPLNISEPFVFCRKLFDGQVVAILSGLVQVSKSRVRIRSPGKPSADPLLGHAGPDLFVQRGEHEPRRERAQLRSSPVSAGPSRAAV